MSPRVALLAVTAALAAVATGFVIVGIEHGPGISDTPVYRFYGERIAGGDLPYRDFAVEYPPGALVLFLLPALVSSTDAGFDSAFEAWMVVALSVASVLIVLALAALHATVARTVAAVGAFLVGTAVLGPFVLTRFDLYAATATLAAVCAVLHAATGSARCCWGSRSRRRSTLPFCSRSSSRGSGVARGSAAALRCLGLTVGTALAVYLPFALLAPTGVARSVWRQVGRPLQIESLGRGCCLLSTMPPACRSGGRPAPARRT